MTSIVVSVSTVKQDVPPGIAAAGKFDFALFKQGDTVPVVTLDSDTPGVTFPDPPPGDYTVGVRRLDNNGNALTSALVSSLITVPSPDQFDAPASISVSLG